MARVDNLIPTSKRSKEEARELGKQGGIASGEARRRKKSMREWAQIIGALDAKVVQPDGTLLEGADLDADVMMQQYRKAHEGNTKAAIFISDIKGERTTNVNISQPLINVATEQDKQRILDAISD